MTKPELINAVSAKAGVTKKDTRLFVDTILEVITETMAAGESVSLHGFGSFNVISKEACERRNPMTGDTIEVPAKLYPRFKASKVLKDTMNA